MNHPNRVVMQRAIKLAKNHYKDGVHAEAAIVIKGNTIISESFTTIIKDKKTTHHAEINAISNANKKLDSRYFSAGSTRRTRMEARMRLALHAGHGSWILRVCPSMPALR